jgi:hypothetical protein
MAMVSNLIWLICKLDIRTIESQGLNRYFRVLVKIFWLVQKCHPNSSNHFSKDSNEDDINLKGCIWFHNEISAEHESSHRKLIKSWSFSLKEFFNSYTWTIFESIKSLIQSTIITIAFNPVLDSYFLFG